MLYHDCMLLSQQHTVDRLLTTSVPREWGSKPNSLGGSNYGKQREPRPELMLWDELYAAEMNFDVCYQYTLRVTYRNVSNARKQVLCHHSCAAQIYSPRLR